MKTGASNFRLGTYYWVQYPVGAFPKDGYNNEKIILYSNMLSWCEQTYGPSLYEKDGYNSRWFNASGRFFFRKEPDRMLFLIKWAGRETKN